MKKTIYAAMLLAAMSAGAHAETTVTWNWGDWLAANSNTFAETAAWLVLALLGLAMKALLAKVVEIIKTWQVEQMLSKAIVAAINKTAGASQGKALSFTVANDVIGSAVQFVLDNAPEWLIKWLGGETGIRDRVIARIEVEPGAAIK